jgi:hypothetical protein
MFAKTAVMQDCPMFAKMAVMQDSLHRLCACPTPGSPAPPKQREFQGLDVA